MNESNPDTSSAERGAALIEMAILSIFLIVLVLGVVDVGRGIFTRITLEEAAQEAVALASLEETVNLAAIQNRAVAAVDGVSLTTADITVTCALDSTGNRNTRLITIEITFQQELITPGIELAGPLRLRASATAERLFDSDPGGITC